MYLCEKGPRKVRVRVRMRMRSSPRKVGGSGRSLGPVVAEKTHFGE